MPPGAGRLPLSPAAAFSVVLAIIVCVVLLFLPTAQSMAAIWTRSATFTHGWLVLPAALWFIWQRRQALAAMAPAPWWPALPGIAAGGALWLAGELTGSISPTHLALVILVVSSVVAVTGLAWARVLTFPLAFLFFAVPFGEALIPVLIDWTADFAVLALKLSGVPVFREGNDLTIPTGQWSVVEACSGVRYLLASLMVGMLYAWTMYRSPERRALFVLASLLMPIVANWLRAYLIILLGHLSDNKLAAGVDHLIYGWVFFGIVILAMFLIGARWREDEAAPIAARASAPDPAASPRTLLTGVALVAATLALWPVLSLALMAPADARAVSPVQPVAQAGWTVQANASPRWQPRLHAPRALLALSYRSSGATVWLHAGFFRAQTQDSELVNSLHQIAQEQGGWREVARASAVAPVGGESVTWRTTIVRDTAGGGYERIWLAYWVGADATEGWTASGTRAKLNLALDRLLRRSDTAAWVSLSTTHDPERPHQSEAVLRGFVADMGASLQQALAETAK